MKLLRKVLTALSILFFLFVSMVPHKLQAQQITTPIQCGTILEAEFTTANNSHNYGIDLDPGDTLRVHIEPIGSSTRVHYFLFDPADVQIDGIYGNSGSPSEDSTVVGSTGVYRINLKPQRNTVGAYTLFVGCTLRNGTVIAPGDIMPAPTPIPPTVIPTLSPGSPAFVGFPGLASKDFSTAFLVPLVLGAATQGTIPIVGDAVLAFTLDAAAGDMLDLSFTRVSGNLNLGLVVLSANNEVVFQASLVTSQTLNTRFTLPAAGQYTIGIFRVDLLPPAAPEATAFQVQAALNP